MTTHILVAAPPATVDISVDKRIAALIPHWRDALDDDNHQLSGIRRYIDQLGDFVRTLDHDACISELTAEAIKRHKRAMRQRGCSGATIGNALTAIRSFCRWAIEEGYLDHDPTLRVRWPKREDPNVVFLRQEDDARLQALLEAEPATLTERQRFQWRRNRRMITIMRHAGLRISEAARLLWRDVDLVALTLFVRRGKGGRNRTVPINDTLLAELRAVERRRAGDAVAGRADGRPMTGKSAAHVFERWLPRHFDVRISAHVLRRAFGTDLKRTGADLDTVRRLLGHKHLTTTQRYLDGGSEEEHAAVRRLDRRG